MISFAPTCSAGNSVLTVQAQYNSWHKSVRWKEGSSLPSAADTAGVFRQADSWLHVDPQGQFYDRQAQPITRETALEPTGQSSTHSLADKPQVNPGSKDTTDLGLSL